MLLRVYEASASERDGSFSLWSDFTVMKRGHDRKIGQRSSEVIGYVISLERTALRRQNIAVPRASACCYAVLPQNTVCTYFIMLLNLGRLLDNTGVMWTARTDVLEMGTISDRG
ncbi:unnamed protein product [Toxocara canis]|uniref:Uncharacterized protein n=1 Tax=Toxocara canis TaxID=6265 RepID=A0A183US00_TOXCA|nr:unnamed protein product [Toxocara canis]